MITADLLKILQCPEDRTPLAEADAATVARLNEQIGRRQLRNRGGELVVTIVEGALVRRGGDVAYPVVDGIPILLVDEGISLAQLTPSTGAVGA